MLYYPAKDLGPSNICTHGPPVVSIMRAGRETVYTTLGKVMHLVSQEGLGGTASTRLLGAFTNPTA